MLNLAVGNEDDEDDDIEDNAENRHSCSSETQMARRSKEKEKETAKIFEKMIIPYSRLDAQHTTISIEDLIQYFIHDQDHIIESSL